MTSAPRQHHSHGRAALLRAAEEARRGLRRDGDEYRPLGERATITRNVLLGAAYDCFVRDGYGATSVQDIHLAAGVSIGTFYQYFHDKADLVATLIGEAIVATVDEVFPVMDLSDPESVDVAVESYVLSYAGIADFQRVWEEVTFVEPRLATMRRDLGSVVDDALADLIRAGQDNGLCDVDLNPHEAAAALTAMVDRLCYLTFVVDGHRDEASVSSVVKTLATVWRKTLLI